MKTNYKIVAAIVGSFALVVGATSVLHAQAKPPAFVLGEVTVKDEDGSCPATGLSVQGWIADDPTEGEAETYEAVTCTACTRVHLANPETGRVLGTDED